MPTLDLTPEEARLIKEYLEADLSDLRMEIVETDRLEFKEALKHRKEALLRVMEKLQQIAEIPA